MVKNKKAVVVLSGGQDSTTALFFAKHIGFEVVATVTFDYGQRHDREIEAAARIAHIAGVPNELIVFPSSVLKGTSPLVSDAELEQYDHHSVLPGGLEKTFVPMRNQLFLTVAANRAYVEGALNLFTGVAQEDFGGYPDCRYEFIGMLEAACNLGTFTAEEGTIGPLRIHTPLMWKSKADTVRVALAIPDAYAALAYTHTGYDGAYPPTGKDHATLLRAKGFEEAGVPDPLIYRAYMEGAMELPDTPNYNKDDELISAHMADIRDFVHRAGFRDYYDA